MRQEIIEQAKQSKSDLPVSHIPKPSSIGSVLLAESPDLCPPDLIHNPSIQEIITMKDQYQHPNLNHEKGLGDLIAMVPPIESYIFTDQPNILPSFPTLPENPSPGAASLLMSIVDKDIDREEFSDFETRVDNDFFLEPSELSNSPKPNPIVGKVRNYFSKARDFLSTFVTDKPETHDDSCIFGSAKKSHHEKKFETIFNPVSDHKEVKVYHGEMMLYTIYLEKSMCELIKILLKYDDSSLGVGKIEICNLDIESPENAFETELLKKKESIEKKRFLITNLLRNYSKVLKERHKVSFSDIIELDFIQKGPYGDLKRAYCRDTGKLYLVKTIKETPQWPVICFELHAIKQLQLAVKISALEDTRLMQIYAIEYEERKNEYKFLLESGIGTLKHLINFREETMASCSTFSLPSMISNLLEQIELLRDSGIYHRDIKPQNIVLTQTGFLKLYDFSCACLVEGLGVKRLGISGTAFYMAPEIKDQWERNQMIADYNPFSTDLYSLGMTFISILAQIDHATLQTKLSHISNKYGSEIGEILGQLVFNRTIPDVKFTHNIDIMILEKFRDYQMKKMIKKWVGDGILINNKDLVNQEEIVGDIEKTIIDLRVQTFLETHQQKTDLIRLGLTLAQVDKEKGNYKGAKYELERLKGKIPKNDSELYVSAILIKAELLAYYEKYEHSKQAFKKAKMILSSKGNQNDCILARIHECCGELERKMENYEIARKKFKTAIKILLNHHDPGFLIVMQNLEEIGLCYELSGDLTHARKIYENILNKETKNFIYHTTKIAKMYVRIAQLDMKESKWNQGLKNLSKALDLFQSSRGKKEKTLDIASVYGHIGNLFRHQNRDREALTYYFKSLEIFIENGEEKSETGLLCDHIGWIYFSKGNYDEAIKYFQEALRIKIHVYGEEHPQIVLTYCNLGEIFRLKTELKSCIGTYAHALDIALKVLGKEDPRLADVFYGIGQYYNDHKDYQKAVNSYNKAIEIFEKRPELHFHKIAELYMRIGRVYEDRDRPAEAMRNFKTSLEIIEERFQSNSIEKAVVFECQGRCLEKLENWSKAIEFYQIALDIYKIISSEKYKMKIILILEVIGDCYRRMHQNKESLICLKKALDYRMKFIENCLKSNCKKYIKRPIMNIYKDI